MSSKLLIVIFAITISIGQARLNSKVGLLNSAKDAYQATIELAKNGLKKLPDSYTNGAYYAAGAATVGGFMWLGTSAYCYYYPDSCEKGPEQMDPATLKSLNIMKSCVELIKQNKYNTVKECQQDLNNIFNEL